MKLLLLSCFLLPLSMKAGDYDKGYKNLQWGIDRDNLQSLIVDQTHNAFSDNDDPSEGLFWLAYYDKHSVCDYEFFNNSFYSVRCTFQSSSENSSELLEEIVKSFIKKMNKQYGIAKINEGVYYWKNKYVRINLSFTVENSFLGDLYGNIEFNITYLPIESKYNAFVKGVNKNKTEILKSQADSILNH